MPDHPQIRFGAFTVDLGARQLAGRKGPIHLTPKAFALLRILIDERPNAVDKDELVERLWKGAAVTDGSLTVLVAEIRKALDDDPRSPRVVRTVHGSGYAFCADAKEVSPPARTGKASSKWCLVWRDRTFKLAEGENLVGRHPQSDVWIDSSGVSRRHARIAIHGEAATIEDLGSTNHTYVRGAPIAAATTLRHGDLLRFGPDAELEFRLWDVKTTTIGRR